MSRFNEYRESVVGWRVDLITNAGWWSGGWAQPDVEPEWFVKSRAVCLTGADHRVPEKRCTCGHNAVEKFSDLLELPLESLERELDEEGGKEYGIAISRVKLYGGAVIGGFVERPVPHGCWPDPPSTWRGARMTVLGPIITSAADPTLAVVWQRMTGMDVRHVGSLVETVSDHVDTEGPWWESLHKVEHTLDCSGPPHEHESTPEPGFHFLRCPECGVPSSSNLEWRREHHLVLDADDAAERDRVEGVTR